MPGKAEVVLGGSKRFECQVVGNPRPSIRWFKDGIDITNKTRYNFEYDEDGIISMYIENVLQSDGGFYRCRAENSQGVATTAAYLHIIRKYFSYICYLLYSRNTKLNLVCKF